MQLLATHFVYYQEKSKIKTHMNPVRDTMSEYIRKTVDGVFFDEDK